jgi:hypothetical protein
MTKNELQLNKLINQMMDKQSYLTTERDNQLIHALGMVSSLSQDGDLSQLIELMDKHFEYGKYF